METFDDSSKITREKLIEEMVDSAEQFMSLVYQLPPENRAEIVKSFSEMIAESLASPLTDKALSDRIKEIIKANIDFLAQDGKIQ